MLRGSLILCFVVLPACVGRPPSVDDRPLRTLRVAVRADFGDSASLSSLSYGGGFETKTWLYETLIRRGADGRILPGLAESWEFDESGADVRLTLRRGAMFHDGSACDAAAVRDHFERWIHQPEHAWLGACDVIQRVEAEDDRTLRITLSRPYALLPDLCATNPCAVLGPGSFDSSGGFLQPIGTGPFRYRSSGADGRVHSYERTADGMPLELLRFGPDESPLEALLQGRLDLLVGGWIERVPRDRIAALELDPRFAVRDAAGSSVVYLSFRLQLNAPTADASVRRRIAATIDRHDLCQEVELGHADPCHAWGAPTIRTWPRPTHEDETIGTAVDAGERAGAPLRLLLEAGHRTEALGTRLARQLRSAGFDVAVDRRGRSEMRAAVDAGNFDLRLEETWGLPYDPILSLRARFLPPPEAPTASTFQHTGVDPRLIALIESASAEPRQSDREEIFREIQALLTREALIVPLLVPRRVAVMRREIEGVRLDPDLYRLDLREVPGHASR